MLFSFFGSFLVFAFVLFSFFPHLFASFSSAAEANQAEGKINRQITSVRRRRRRRPRRRLDEYFCCSFWVVRFCFSSSSALFLFCFCFCLSLFFSLSSSLFALSAALCCVACFALFAHRTHCAHWRNGSLTIPLGSIRGASQRERDKHYARLWLPIVSAPLLVPSCPALGASIVSRMHARCFRFSGCRVCYFFLFPFPLRPPYAFLLSLGSSSQKKSKWK